MFPADAAQTDDEKTVLFFKLLSGCRQEDGYRFCLGYHALCGGVTQATMNLQIQMLHMWLEKVFKVKSVDRLRNIVALLRACKMAYVVCLGGASCELAQASRPTAGFAGTAAGLQHGAGRLRPQQPVHGIGALRCAGSARALHQVEPGPTLHPA